MDLTPQRLVVTSRDPAKAAALAAECGAVAAGFDQLPELLTAADVIVTGTGATHPLITAAMLETRQTQRPAQPLVIVDIAVPRDVEPAVRALPGVFLYDMDDLQRRSQTLQDQRRRSVAVSHGLLAAHVEAFLAWNAARDVGPIVQALYAWAEEHAQKELAEYQARHPELSTQQQQDIERMLHRVVGKLLHTPVTQLTHQAQANARPMLASALKRLFQLDPQRPESASPLDSAAL
jgi:glutamyl-tRNA reductase